MKKDNWVTFFRVLSYIISAILGWLTSSSFVAIYNAI